MENIMYYKGYEGEKHYCITEYEGQVLINTIKIWEGYFEDIYSFQNSSKGISYILKDIIDGSIIMDKHIINCNVEFLFLKNDLQYDYDETKSVISLLSNLYSKGNEVNHQLVLTTGY